MLSATPRPSRTSPIAFTSGLGLRRWYLSCTPVFDESTSTGLPVHSVTLSTSAVFSACWRSMWFLPTKSIPTSRASLSSGPRCSGFSSRRATGLATLRMSVSAVVAL